MHALPLEIKNNTIFRTLTTGQSEKKACSGYELTNHLGNVIAVVGDNKKPELTEDYYSSNSFEATANHQDNSIPARTGENTEKLTDDDYSAGVNVPVKAGDEVTATIWAKYSGEPLTTITAGYEYGAGETQITSGTLPVSLIIPETIDVTEGNSANKDIFLEVELENTPTSITLRYTGGASVSTLYDADGNLLEATSDELPQAQQYQYNGSTYSAGDQLGDAAHPVKSISIQSLDGDKNDPSGNISVRANVYAANDELYTIMASKGFDYNRPATYTLTGDAEFFIPNSIPVTSGVAGSHKLLLEFTETTNPSFPVDAQVEYIAGTDNKFVFNQCIGCTYLGGDAVKASGDVTLEVNNTDPAVNDMTLQTEAVLHTVDYSGARGLMVLNILDEDGHVIQHNGQPQWFGTYVGSEAHNNWVEYTSTYTVPADINRNDIQLSVYAWKPSDANAEPVWFDDLSVSIDYATSEVRSYLADVKSTSDYYPGGFPMPGRSYNLGSYRFGHNTQESDPEISGSWGTHYTAQFWMYDSRIIRRWNLDPKPNPSISQYNCFNGNPIWYVDIQGDSARARISRSMRKELGISRKEAKNYTPEKVAQVFEQEYGMNVEVRNGWLHYTGESENQPESYSSTAKEMWKKELGSDYRSKEKLVFTNKGENLNRNFRTSFINLSQFDENLNFVSPAKGYINQYSSPNDANLLRSFNLGRVMEHEFLGHSVMELEDYTVDYFGQNEFFSGTMTAMKLVNSFRIEIGLQNYQRLTYGVQDSPMVFFGNPDKANTPIFILSFEKK